MNRQYRKWDAVFEELLSDPKFAAEVLSEALELEDFDLFLASLKSVIKVHGSLAAIADKADMSRSTVYSTLGETSNPGIRTLIPVLHAAGYRLNVTRLSRAHR